VHALFIALLGWHAEVPLFSQTTEYALRAMAYLAAHEGELAATPLMAGHTKVPANYLSKVLQQLAAAGLITGRRGVGGGYRLARAPRDIRLLDVIRAVTELERLNACPLGLHTPAHQLCPLHRRMDQVTAAVIEIYSGVTLADLTSDPHSKEPLCSVEGAGRSAARLSVSAGRGRGR
jgi:Rrf2 family nitric oxide-sensitive transcriptional repressor